MARSTDRGIRSPGDKERAVKLQVEKLLDMPVKDEKYPKILYRGERLEVFGCKCSGLIPKYARLFCQAKDKPQVSEGSLLKECKSLMDHHLKDIDWWQRAKDSLSDWDILLLAQHYGLETRFVDWTPDPRVALWFATHKWFGTPKTEQDGDAVVWICNLKKVRGRENVRWPWRAYVNPDVEDSPFFQKKIPHKTLFYKPPRNLVARIARVANQKSVMCRQVFRPKDQEYGRCLMVPLDQNVDFKDAVERVVISRFDFKAIQDELERQLKAEKFADPFPGKDETHLLAEDLRFLSPRCPWEIKR